MVSGRATQRPRRITYEADGTKVLRRPRLHQRSSQIDEFTRSVERQRVIDCHAAHHVGNEACDEKQARREWGKHAALFLTTVS